MKNKLPLILLFAAGLIFRLLISSPAAYHVDILSIAGWGRWIGEHSTHGFYENGVWTYSWPTQPPLVNILYGFCWQIYVFILELFRQLANTIVQYHLAPGHMIWFFNFLLWFDKNIDPVIQFPNGFILIIKLFAIIADILIALLVFKLAQKHHVKHLYLWPSLYLFSPFSFYISALWGQYDQISYLFLLLSFLLVKNTAVSPLLIATSLNLKPTSAIFIPLYLFLFFKTKPKIKATIIGVLFTVCLTLWSLLQFTKGNPLFFIKNQLVKTILYKSEYRVTNNSYNFWHIFTGDIGHNQNETFIFLSYKIWGLAFFMLINYLAIKQLKKTTPKYIISALYIVGAGSWLFLTNMLERYYFSGIVTALFVSIYHPKTLKLFLISSLIFFLNLYRGWWSPHWLQFIKPVLAGPHLPFGFTISLINLAVYLRTITIINHHEK